jgi:hypothetical protein
LTELEDVRVKLILGYRSTSLDNFLIDSHSPPSGRLLRSFN